MEPIREDRPDKPDKHGYQQCLRCGSRRPLKALGEPLALQVAKALGFEGGRVCLDEAYCSKAAGVGRGAMDEGAAG